MRAMANLSLATNFSSPRAEFFAGVKATLVLIPSVMPFGMVYGALALASGIAPDAALAMSSIVFAGSAQFVAAQLVAGGASGLVLLLTTLVINLRHMLYGISVSPWVSHLPARWKWPLAYLLTDETYVVTILHYEQGDHGQKTHKHWFYLGSGLLMWSSWQVSTAAGVIFGSNIPPAWSLDFAGPLTFIALVVPALTDRASVVAALAAGVAAILLAGMPLKLGVIAASLLGIAAGALVDRRQPKEDLQAEGQASSGGKE